MYQDQALDLEKQFTAALKSIARRSDLKSYVEQTPQLNRILRHAAARFVTGEARQDGLDAGQKLIAKGYAISLEYIGENTTDASECEAAVKEMMTLIDDFGQKGTPARVSFDLSHIGLSLDTELAFSNLMKLAEQAQRAGVELFISMEESSKTGQILSVYKRAASIYPNVGITLQAQLKRTPQDLAMLASPCRVRIVKGAYQESDDRSIPRSPALNERYVELVESSIRQGHFVSIATHDEQIIKTLLDQGLTGSNIEFEMLYGIRPDLSSRLKAAGHPVRIYLTYGQEWYLYLCHRIAEYPPNLFQAVIDLVSNEEIEPVQSYN
ncbi:proline dehydrogenase family protein [Paenibacillus sp. PL91]|uniref:proline dehydrogenase family protein n=1 Tax=Paenibacillus sp. PL91 TaxID=2729538 RepID=UPI00145D11EE|nr:proline dehydrogenase family protein [Paenibacillus sp. PL91]MBC9200756.1 proline dehydrogenase family protein [Paenibacillus sp. PL91]